jgi:uncharacterized protein (DUF2141 family)
MKTCNCLVLLVLSVGLAFGAKTTATAKLIVNMDKFDLDSGVAVVCLWDKQDGFLADAGKALKKCIVKIKNKQAVAVFDSIPMGVYAVSVMHDLDGDGIMKLDKLGLPTEGYGVSNDIHARFGPPLFGDAKFIIAIRKKEILIHVIE